MRSDFLQRTEKDVTIDLSDGDYDVLSTCCGFNYGVSKIVLSNKVSKYSDGVLNVYCEPDQMHAVSTQSFGETSVTSVSVADVYDGTIRIGGDPYVAKGRIVTVMIMEADMPISTMARAGITVTEGITAVMQDMLFMCNNGPATGSLDQDVILVRKKSPLYLRGAGNHCKLGELIGEATIESVKTSAIINLRSILKTISVTYALQNSGYSVDRMKDIIGPKDAGTFERLLEEHDDDTRLLAAVGVTLHIRECVNWGLFPIKDGIAAGKEVIRSMLGFESEEKWLMESVIFGIWYYLRTNYS